MTTMMEPSKYTDSQLEWEVMYQFYVASDPRFEERLPQAFHRLYAGEVTRIFVVDWIKNTRRILIQCINNSIHQAQNSKRRLYDRFVTQCLLAGIVGCMLRVSERYADEPSPASYMSFQIISCLSRYGDASQRPMVYKEFMALDGYSILLKALCYSPKIIQKACAAVCLQELTSRGRLAEEFTISEIASFLVASTRYSICSNEDLVKDLLEPSNFYMHAALYADDNCEERGEIVLCEAIRNASSWFVNTQDAAMSTCIDLLWRKEPLTKKDILGIIITSPEVLDNLLTLSSYARVKLFPKKKSDSSAIMLLCFFMMFPVNNLMNKDSIEFRAATQCNRILLAREDAMIHLVCARGKAGFADASSIFKLMHEDEGGRYYNMAKNLMAKIEMRTAGALGICSLRIMMNFALLEDVPTGVLFTILPVAYSACGRAPTEAEVNAAKRRDPARGRQTETIRQQRHIYEVQLRPQHQLGLNDSLVRKLQMYIPPETMMGPTLLFRVLKRLAERGCNLDLMRKSIEIPLEDQYISTPLPSLYHVYQIVDSKVIGKLIRLCVNRRIPQRRELGNTLIANKPNLAKPTYDSAMQLAQAVVSFGMDPENAGLEGVIENSDAIKRAYQEMVLCTGNYSEAAAAMKDWEIAITYAQNAIELCRKFPMEEAVAMGWDVISTEQKNIRRLKRYLRGLEAKDAAIQ